MIGKMYVVENNPMKIEEHALFRKLLVCSTFGNNESTLLSYDMAFKIT